MRWWEELFREEMTGYGQMMSRAPQPFGRRPALLVIDVVRAFTGTRGQTLAESAAEFPTSCGPAAWESMPHLAETIEAARRAGAPVVYTTGMPGSAEPFGGTVKGELDGMNSPMDRPHALDIPDEIAPKPGELVLQKPKASAFFLTALPAYLNRSGCAVTSGGREGLTRTRPSVPAVTSVWARFVRSRPLRARPHELRSRPRMTPRASRLVGRAAWCPSAP